MNKFYAKIHKILLTCQGEQFFLLLAHILSIFRHISDPRTPGYHYRLTPRHIAFRRVSGRGGGAPSPCPFLSNRVCSIQNMMYEVVDREAYVNRARARNWNCMFGMYMRYACRHSSSCTHLANTAHTSGMSGERGCPCMLARHSCSISVHTLQSHRIHIAFTSFGGQSIFLL